MAGGAKRAPGKPVIADSWKADILGALDAPKPPGVMAGPVARPSPPAAAGDLELVRRILQARDPLALAELEAGIVEAGKGSEALAVWLARPIPRREARDPLDAASDALAAAAAFVESLPPNDRRAATILNAASTLAKTVETITAKRPREPTRDEVEERIAKRRDAAIEKISEYTDDARAKLEADRAELVVWMRSNLGPVIAGEVERRIGVMLGEAAPS